jgi:hypothetical protein
MRTLGNDNQRSFIVEMSREEYSALANLQRVSEGRFNSGVLSGLGIDMADAIVAVIAFVMVQDVMGKFEAALEGLRKALRNE